MSSQTQFAVVLFLAGFVNVPVQACPGDADGNEEVNLVDYASFHECFRSVGEPLPPECTSMDFDLDNDVDFADFSFFQSLDGRCCPSWSQALDLSSMDSPVSALAAFDDGAGLALYAGGLFGNAGGNPVFGIAKWDGSTWSALDGGMNQFVFALAVHDAGQGELLYAGGAFTTAGNISASRIARWDGLAWSALGEGMNQAVFDFATWGADLYAGGRFTMAGGSDANYIARWDGRTWSSLGDGLNGWMHALVVFDDGEGPALYAGGEFTMAGATEAPFVAKWNGSTWSALGSGMNGAVFALASFDDGTGSALYAGGSFTTADGVSVGKFARWDGSSWSAPGNGTSSFLNDRVKGLTVFDDGSGPVFCAGGRFTGAGGARANYIAQWDGVSWSPLGVGTNTTAGTLLAFDNGTGPALYVGGAFTLAGGFESSYLAAWSRPLSPCSQDE